MDIEIAEKAPVLTLKTGHVALDAAHYIDLEVRREPSTGISRSFAKPQHRVALECLIHLFSYNN